MRPVLVTLMFGGCWGGSSAPAPSEPTPVDVPEPEPAVAAPADRAALVASLASLPSQTLVNELSGETVGVTITLPGPTDIAGVPCTEVVHAYDDSWGCTLSAAFARDGYTTREGAFGSFHYGTGRRAAVVFMELLPGFPATVGGVPCAEYAHFHPNGALLRCTLGGPHTFGANPLPAGATIELRGDGTLASTVIYEPQTLGGREVPAGEVHFAADGTVSEVLEGYFGD